jgi:hypothetical protein
MEWLRFSRWFESVVDSSGPGDATRDRRVRRAPAALHTASSAARIARRYSRESRIGLRKSVRDRCGRKSGWALPDMTGLKGAQPLRWWGAGWVVLVVMRRSGERWGWKLRGAVVRIRAVVSRRLGRAPHYNRALKVGDPPSRHSGGPHHCCGATVAESPSWKPRSVVRAGFASPHRFPALASNAFSFLIARISEYGLSNGP